MAPTLTTRLLLSKPAPTDLYNVGIPNANMDIIDRIGGVTICTSTTRPNTPFPGMTIYETDTAMQRVWVPGSPGSWAQISLGASIICTSTTRPSSPIPGTKIFETDTALEYVWDGAAWMRLTVGLAGGKIYTTAATLATVPSGSTETSMAMDTGNVFMIAGRTYRLLCKFEAAQSVLGDVWTVRVRQTNITGTIWATLNALPFKAAATKQQFECSAVVTSGTPDGNRFFMLSAQRVSGSGTFTVTSTAGVRPHMLVELMGDDGVFTAV